MLIQWRASSHLEVPRSSPSRGRAGRRSFRVGRSLVSAMGVNVIISGAARSAQAHQKRQDGTGATPFTIGVARTSRILASSSGPMNGF